MEENFKTQVFEQCEKLYEGAMLEAEGYNGHNDNEITEGLSIQKDAYANIIDLISEYHEKTSDKLNGGIMKMENDSHFQTNRVIESLAGEELYKWYPIKDDGEYWTDYDEVYSENITKISTIVTNGTSIYTYEECPCSWDSMAKSGNWKYMRIKID